MAEKREKGLLRGGVGGQEGELENRIAPEGSLRESETRPLPGSGPQAGQPPRGRNPFLDHESQARIDREKQLKHEVD